MTSGQAPFDVALLAGYGESVIPFRGALLKEMRSRGYSTVVIAPGLSEKARAWFTREGVAFHELPLARTGISPLQDLRSCWHLCRAFRKYQPRLVLAYTVKPVVYGLPVGWLSGVTSQYALITGLGYSFTQGGNTWVGSLVRLLYAGALRLADGVFFQNPDDHELFRNHGLLAPDTPSFIVSGSGIDIQAFSPKPVPSGPPRFLMIARLLGDKGVREYVGAARLIKARNPEVMFSLAGYLDANPSAITQRELDGWVASGAVQYLGKLDDVRPALADCTVYVLPSYREGTPRTVLEAMASGRAIVTSDAPGCRETVVHGDNGYLVAARSVEELVAALQNFVEQPELAQRMGRVSRRIAESKYDVRSVNQAMMAGMAL